MAVTTDDRIILHEIICSFRSVAPPGRGRTFETALLLSSTTRKLVARRAPSTDSRRTAIPKNKIYPTHHNPDYLLTCRTTEAVMQRHEYLALGDVR